MKAKGLVRGDTIGIIAPSTPILKEMKDRLENGITLLESLGFKIKLGNFIYSRTLLFSATPEEKAQDINSFFADPSIKMILAAQGGATTNACLDYINWQMVKKNPKIVMGISDITVLLNAIQAKTGLVTYHGLDLLWGFGNNPVPYEINAFIDGLMFGSSRKLRKKDEWKVVRPGEAKGRLIGGNLGSFIKLLGTPYFPETNESILFFEAMNILPEECHTIFYQLKQAGVFKKTRGIIIGYNFGLQHKLSFEQMENILLDSTKEFDFPILKINEFGHNCANATLPIGLKVRMDTVDQEIEFCEEVTS